MPPRQRAIHTGFEDRLARLVAADGRQALGGMSRIGDGRGRRSNANVLVNALEGDDGQSSGAARMLCLSVTGDSIAPGGDYVEFDTIVAQHGFDGVMQSQEGYWVHPIDGVYTLFLSLAWDAYGGGGTIRIELDGVQVPEGLIVSGTSGDQALGVIAYRATAGLGGRIKVTHTSDTDEPCDASLHVSIPDPDKVEAQDSGEWTKLFSADAYDITFDGTSWFTTPFSEITVSERGSEGTVLNTFDVPEHIHPHSGVFGVNGITFDGTDLWIDGASEVMAHYTPAGVLVDSAPMDGFPTGASHRGIAFDGTSFWVVEIDTDAVYEFAPAGGTALSSFSLPAGNYGGMAFHDGDLWIVDIDGSQVLRYTTAGSLVSSLDTSAGVANPTGIHIAGAGELYVSKDGDGVYRYDGTL